MFRFKRSGAGYVVFHRASGCMLGYVVRKLTKVGLMGEWRSRWQAAAPPLRWEAQAFGSRIDAARRLLALENAARLAARPIALHPDNPLAKGN